MSSKEEGSTEGSSTTSMIIQLIAFVIVILMTLTGNSLVCISVCVFRRLRTSPNLVLVSLAITDLCMVVIMALNAVTLISGRWLFGTTGCHAVASIGLTLSFISILHLCLLSIDRYIAIFKPFRYHFIVKKRRIYVVLPLLWLTPAIALNLPLADYDFRGSVYNCLQQGSERKGSAYTVVMVFIFVLVPFTIIFITNAKVFQVAYRHARTLSRLERSLRQAEAEPDAPEEQARRTRQTKLAEFRAMRREIRTAKTFAVVVGVFLVCYVPFFVAGTYRKYAGREVVPDVAIMVTTWVAFSNSFCNPLVYGLRHAPFRKAFKKLCSCTSNKCGRRRRKSNQIVQMRHQSSQEQTCSEVYDTKL